MNNEKTNLEELLSSLSEGLSTEDLLFSSIASDLAVAISSKRIDMRLTQKEFAEMLGKSQAMVSKWENGECNFQLKTLIEIAQKLNLTVDVSLKKPKVKPVDRKNFSDKIIDFPVKYFVSDSPSQVWEQASSPSDELIEM